MAYSHTEYEVYMLGSAAVAANGRGGQTYITLTTGVRARWTPGFMPHVVRNVALIGTSTKIMAAGVVSFRTCSCNATTAVSGNQIASVTFTATEHRGDVFYKSTMLNTTVNPGTDVVAVCTTKATTTPVKMVLYVEPKWETPGNLSNMIAG